MTREKRPDGVRRRHRMLPDSWQGDGREARWRRSRARRVAAALLCAVAVFAVVGAVRPADPATHLVAVAAHDLPAGSRLTSADVRQAHWAVGDRVPGALDVDTVTGSVLTAPITAGEPFTTTRVRSARSWPSVPAGRVVVAVASPDTAMLRVLRPGDRVDLIDTGKGDPIATAAPVVSIMRKDAHSTSGLGTVSSPETPAVLVAVTPAQAAAVGSATATRSGGLGGGIQLALRATS